MRNFSNKIQHTHQPDATPTKSNTIRYSSTTKPPLKPYFRFSRIGDTWKTIHLTYGRNGRSAHSSTCPSLETGAMPFLFFFLYIFFHDKQYTRDIESKYTIRLRSNFHRNSLIFIRYIWKTSMSLIIMCIECTKII